MSSPSRRIGAATVATAALIAAPVAKATPDHTVPLISEHGAGQIHAVAPQQIPLVSEHGAGQSGDSARIAQTTVAPQAALSSASDSFDWRSAGVGAAVTAGAIALLGGALLSTRQLRTVVGHR